MYSTIKQQIKRRNNVALLLKIQAYTQQNKQRNENEKEKGKRKTGKSSWKLLARRITTTTQKRKFIFVVEWLCLNEQSSNKKKSKT